MRHWLEDVEISEQGLIPGLPLNEDHVKLAKLWIKTYLVPRKTINKRIGSSYHLKHIVENWAGVMDDYGIVLHDETGKAIQNNTYISNGAFISAMLQYEYGFMCFKGSINPYFAAQYNGPYIQDSTHGKSMPHSDDEWDLLLKPFLKAINPTDKN